MKEYNFSLEQIKEEVLDWVKKYPDGFSKEENYND